MKKWLTRLSPVAAVGGLLAVFAFVLPTACVPPQSQTKSTTVGVAAAATDPWPKFVLAVRTAPDPKTIRGAVADLQSGLTANPTADQPRAADPSAVEVAASGLKLTEVEKRFVLGAEFTLADANHLAECLYLLDCAATLGVTNADPVAVRAGAAFRFVCRQMVLHPRVVRGEVFAPVPPAFALSSGSGSGLERAFAFVALCRQMDLDAYLIGEPAADRPWHYRPKEKEKELPKGPFWAVGVRDGTGILLFDPWRGEAVPFKDTGRPASLGEVRADPTVVPWVSDKQKPWDVTADQMKASGVHLSVPLPALAPRLLLLQDKLKAEVGVQCSVDWAAAVRAAEGAADGAPAGGWNPAGDPYTPVRGLDNFLPEDQGGADRGKGGAYGAYLVSALPLDRIVNVPAEVRNDNAGQALKRKGMEVYAGAFVAPPTPREKIQRGLYADARGEMVRHRDQFERAAERLQNIDANAAGVLSQWYTDLNAAYDQVSRARSDRSRAAEVPQLEQRADALVKNSPGPVSVVVTQMLADVAAAEATYLLALVAHEQAEATQVGLDRAVREAAADATRGGAVAEAKKKVKPAWAAAVGGWTRYAERADAQAGSYPGRKEHAAALQARAEALAKAAE